MTAKEMFEKLGFEEYKNYRIRTKDDIIAYKNEMLDCYIYFYDYKAIELRCDKALNIEIYQAINKQVEELDSYLPKNEYEALNEDLMWGEDYED